MSEMKTLSAEDLIREHRVMTTCWNALQPLDAEARYRVIQWLQQWAQDEMLRQSEHDIGGRHGS